MRLRARGFIAIAAVACAVGFLACGEDSGDAASVEQTLPLEAFDFYFDPTALTAELDAEVTVDFTNNGTVAHSFTAPDLDVELVADGGETSDVTFTAPNEPGSYDFFCKFHPDDMQGTISIGGSDEPVEEQPGNDDTD